MLRGVNDLAAAMLEGASSFTAWRKTPTQTTGAGIWFDLSMSPGNPAPNYYADAPLVAATMSQSANGGIPHGGAVSPLTKHLKRMVALTLTATAVPLPLIVCDYLLFYPFVDMGTTDPQSMDNTVALPRYADGRGVRIMTVEVAGQSGAGNPQFQVAYVNQDGVSKVTPNISCNTQVVNGTIITSAPNTALSAGPFLPLAPGDSGVRSIESVTFMTPDVGLIAFVLVRPLLTSSIRTIDAPVERDAPVDFLGLPVIVDDAYLNLICLPNGTLSGAPIHGTAEFAWG
ncbi:MAG: hypothetical protein ABI624_10615 [Casimicrobiaceae bacterium]